MTDDGCFRFFLKLHNIFIYSYTCSLKFHYSFHPTKLWINQRCYIHQEWKVLFLPILDKDTQGYICLLSVSRTDDVLCFLPPNSCRILNSDPTSHQALGIFQDKKYNLSMAERWNTSLHPSNNRINN